MDYGMLDVGKVRRESLNHQPRVLPDHPDKREELLARDLLTVGPCFDLEMQKDLLFQSLANPGQASNHLKIIDSYTEVQRCGLGQIVQRHITQNKNRAGDSRFPQVNSFLQGMDAQPIHLGI